MLITIRCVRTRSVGVGNNISVLMLQGLICMLNYFWEQNYDKVQQIITNCDLVHNTDFAIFFLTQYLRHALVPFVTSVYPLAIHFLTLFVSNQLPYNALNNATKLEGHKRFVKKACFYH